MLPSKEIKKLAKNMIFEEEVVNRVVAYHMQEYWNEILLPENGANPSLSKWLEQIESFLSEPDWDTGLEDLYKDPDFIYSDEYVRIYEHLATRVALTAQKEFERRRDVIRAQIEALKHKYTSAEVNKENNPVKKGQDNPSSVRLSLEKDPYGFGKLVEQCYQEAKELEFKGPVEKFEWVYECISRKHNER